MASNSKITKSEEAAKCAPQPVANVASNLALSAYKEVLVGVKPPDYYKIVPEITVTVSYRFEPI